MHRALATAASVLATAAVMTLATGTAQAATSVAHAAQQSLLGWVHLTKTSADGSTTTADLVCGTVQYANGPGTIISFGAVTNPTAACQELAAAGGDFNKLNVHPTWMTPNLNAPVSVAASGSWGAADVNWTRSYTNTGELAKFTGDVYAF